MKAQTTQNERGSAFILTLILTFLLAGAVSLLLLASSSQSRNSMESEQHTERLLFSDNGLGKSKSLIYEDPDSFKSDAAGTDLAPYSIGDSTADGVLRIDEDDTQVWVLAIADTSGAGANGPWVYQVTSISTTNGSSRTARMVLEVDKDPAIAAGAGLGAVVADGAVDLSGNIDVDGNDHDRTGILLASGSGDRPGVVSTGSTNLNGSAAVGGNGNALSGSATSPTHYQDSTTIWDSESNTTDGIDDDSDGMLDDNFGGEFPGVRTAANTALSAPTNTDPQKGAGAFLDWPNGVSEAALFTAATASGTLFTSYSAYSTWLGSATAEEQGGKIIYVRIPDEDDGGPVGPVAVSSSSTFELPTNPALSSTDETRMPSMMIVGRAPSSVDGIIAHDLTIKNLHGGPFQGLLLLDQLDKINSGTTIYGSVVAFDAGVTHLFGNGNSNIYFSSDVLSRLPSADPSAGKTVSDILAWWED